MAGVCCAPWAWAIGSATRSARPTRWSTASTMTACSSGATSAIRRSRASVRATAAMAEDGAPARNIPGLTPARQRRIRAVFRLLSALSPALSARLAARLFITPRTRRVSAQDAGFLATAASRRLPTAHGAVQIYEWPGAGPAVLVLHGWISYAGQLAGIIEGLRAHGLRVVAFEAPAHGRSGGRQADLYSFRDALAAVSGACAPAGAILAHSFGALTAASWLAEDGPAAP